jgi:hypothetical protein
LADFSVVVKSETGTSLGSFEQASNTAIIGIIEKIRFMANSFEFKIKDETLIKMVAST